MLVFLISDDRAERHSFRTTTLLIHSPFLLPSYLGGKRKGEKNKQSRGQKAMPFCTIISDIHLQIQIILKFVTAKYINISPARHGFLTPIKYSLTLSHQIGC